MSKPAEVTPTGIKPLFIRRKQITEITGGSASTVWRLEVEEGLFPKRRKIGTGGGTVGWLYSEVEAFMNSSEVVR